VEDNASRVLKLDQPPVIAVSSKSAMLAKQAALMADPAGVSEISEVAVYAMLSSESSCLHFSQSFVTVFCHSVLSQCFVTVFCQCFVAVSSHRVFSQCFVAVFCHSVLSQCFIAVFSHSVLSQCLLTEFCRSVLSQCFLSPFVCSRSGGAPILFAHVIAFVTVVQMHQFPHAQTVLSCCLHITNHSSSMLTHLWHTQTVLSCCLHITNHSSSMLTHLLHSQTVLSCCLHITRHSSSI